MTASEVSVSGGGGDDKGGGGKGGGAVIAPLSWGLDCSGNGEGVVVRVLATVGCETKCPSNNNNRVSSSSSNFQHLEQQQHR